MTVLIRGRTGNLMLAKATLLAVFFIAGLLRQTQADQPVDRIQTLAQAKANSTDKAKRVESINNFSAETADETLLLTFVEQQQPALLKLLEFMKRKQPAQYEQALKELSKSKQRLSNLEKRDLELYAIELKLWQVRSQLRLLVAEIAVSESNVKNKLRERLAALVEQEVDLDVARIQVEKKHAEMRVELLTTQLQERSADREATVSKALKTWENRVSRLAPRSKPAKSQE